MTEGRRPLGANHWKQVAGRAAAPLGEEFRKLLICPEDDGPLERDVNSGKISCPVCNRHYDERDGVLDAMTQTDPYKISPAQQAEIDERAPGRPFYDEPAQEYGALWSKVEEVLGDVSGKRVLDLCCGRGWAAVWFAKRGARVIAADAAMGDGGLRSAQEAAEAAGVAIDFVHLDVVRMPLAAESIDIVFAAKAVHLMKRPERMLKEVGRMLKPEGKFVNVGEPFDGARKSSNFGGRDPRVDGQFLTVSDYVGIFREGGLRLEPIFAHTDLRKEKGLLDKLKGSIQGHGGTEPRFFLGTRESDFRLPEWPFWRRKSPSAVGA